jgi:hypothetical protein
MGLLDVLSGMSNAESGQRAPASSGGGMSPITKAIIRQALALVPTNKVLARLADLMTCLKVDWADYSEAVLLEA